MQGKEPLVRFLDGEAEEESLLTVVARRRARNGSGEERAQSSGWRWRRPPDHPLELTNGAAGEGEAVHGRRRLGSGRRMALHRR